MNHVAGTAQSEEMTQYIDALQELEEKRSGLDFEIQDLLAEIDT